MNRLNEREPELAARYAAAVARLARVRRDPGPLLWSVLALPRFGNTDWPMGLYFVNTSDETLAEVRAANAGLFRLGDTGYAPTTGARVVFRDVRPGEGVMVDNWHPLADGDFLLQCEIAVIHAGGTQGFRLTGRGAFRSNALFFADGVLRHAIPQAVGQ